MTERADYTFLWNEDATWEEQVEGYQRIIESGQAWRLEGHVGRTAQRMIDAGYCTLGKAAHRDYYGNRVPSRDEVPPGTPGSVEYVERMTRERLDRELDERGPK